MSAKISELALPKAAWWALAIALVLGLPSLWVGLQIDDYFHWGLVNQRSDVLQSHSPASLYGMFSFLDGDVLRVKQLMELGLLPWWTNPQVEYAFWRPLTELTHAIDYLFWPKLPAVMHLHSLFYFALMLWAGFRFFYAFQSQNQAWLWAVFLFALSYTHGVPAGWLANRNSVLAVLFMALTLMAHHQWRTDTVDGQTGRRHSLWSSLFFCMSLLCGEVAVSGGTYLLAYALFYERGAWKSRALSLLPYVVIGLLWLGARELLGYGASGSGHYLDPLQTPLLYLQALASRGLDLLAGLVWVLPPELASALPASRRPLVLALTLLFLYVAFPLLKQDRRARFWLAGSLMCLLPVASTVPHSRLLIAASLGFAGFLGLLFAAWRDQALFLGEAPTRLRRILTSVILCLLMLLQLGLSTLLLPVEMVSLRLAGDSLINSGAKSWKLGGLGPETTPILINPPLSSAGGYINAVRDYMGLPVTRNTWLLASGTRPLTLQTVDNQSLDIVSEQGLYDPRQEGLLRGPQAPFKVGDKVLLSGMEVTVMAVDKGVPTHARFKFAEALTSDAYDFSHWHGGQVAPCALPQVGQSIELELRSARCAQSN